MLAASGSSTVDKAAIKAAVDALKAQVKAAE